jgi:glycolate oxidase FAD binding subunit
MSAAAELRAALGADAVREHPPVALDGAPVSLTLAPEDAEGVGRALRALAACGRAAVVHGGGTKLGLGNLARRVDAFLSTERLAGIVTFDADDGVALVRAGTRIVALQEAVRAAGWDVALEAGAPEATVGGVLAAGETGPRVLRFGRPRDAVLGLGVVLATGEPARCGGRVVKNVTGYDLAKLYVGSLGTLCVIESAWLRLRPAPEVVRVLAGPVRDPEQGVAAARAAADLSSARVAALADDELVVELAGAADLVDAEARRLDEACALSPASPARIDRLEGPSVSSPRDALRFRLSFRPSRAAAAIAPLRAAGGSVVAHVAAAQLLARFDASGIDEVALDAVLRAVRASTAAGEGSAVLEAAPAWAKQGRDVFGDAGPAAALMRAVKQRFDPSGVLAPGRFAAGI